MDEPWRKFKEAKLAFFVLLIFVNALHTTRAVAVEQSLIDGARKEGQLYMYTSLELSKALILLQEFKKKYPFINTQVYRTKSIDLLNKIPQETKAKRYTADVITATFPIWNDLKKGGYLMKYKSPETAVYPKNMKDPEDYWTVFYLQIQGMVYNTKMITPAAAPKKYEDLLDPRWKGKKIAMDYQEQPWYTVMLEILGEEKGMNFMRRLARQELYLRDNKTLLTNLLAAGEFPILANAYMDTTLQIKKSGAPIDWVPRSNPIPAGTHLAGIYAYAPHLNSAKLYYDFLLSEEGQKIQARMGAVVPRPGIESEFSEKIRGFEVHPVNPSMMSRYASINKQFTEIFRPAR